MIYFLRYIISFLLDSTLGLAIIWAGIRLSIYIGQKNGWPTIIFGEYGGYWKMLVSCYIVKFWRVPPTIIFFSLEERLR